MRGVDPKWKMPQQNHEDVPNRWEYPTDQEVWGSRHGPHTAHFAYKNMQKTENLGNTLWLFNITMGNSPFIIDGLPIKTGDFPWLC